MSSLLTPGERPGIWDRVGDLAKRVGRLEAVPSADNTIGAVLFAGSVLNDGTIALGTGFSVIWTTSGSAAIPDQYDLTFDSPLIEVPVILLTPNNNNQPPATVAGTYTATVKNGTPAVTGFSVLTISFDPSATSNDGGWDFACFRPGPG